MTWKGPQTGLFPFSFLLPPGDRQDGNAGGRPGSQGSMLPGTVRLWANPTLSVSRFLSLHLTVEGGRFHPQRRTQGIRAPPPLLCKLGLQSSIHDSLNPQSVWQRSDWGEYSMTLASVPLIFGKGEKIECNYRQERVMCLGESCFPCKTQNLWF